MQLEKYLNLLESIDFWVSHSKTGPAQEFARKLDISVRRLHDYLAYLRDMGVPIVYNSNRRSYMYKDDGQLHIKIYFS